MTDHLGGAIERGLEAHHAILIEWPLEGSPTFHRFEVERGIRERTHDLDSFLDALRGLPRGSVVEKLDRCQVGFHPGMPSEVSRLLEAIFAERAFRKPERFVICTCERTGLTIHSAP